MAASVRAEGVDIPKALLAMREAILCGDGLRARTSMWC